MSARAHMLLALQAVYILPLPSGSVWAVAVCLMAWDVARMIRPALPEPAR